jgi:hypothetical protein
MTQLFELTPAESMLAPFNDPIIAEQLPLRLEPGSATALKCDCGWDGLKVSWDTAQPGSVAARLEFPLVGLPERFDHFVFCHVLPRDVSVAFEARSGGKRTSLGAAVPGKGTRDEATFPIGARPVDAVRCTFTAHGGGHVMTSLQWWGVAQASLVAQLLRRGTTTRTAEQIDEYGLYIELAAKLYPPISEAPQIEEAETA